MFQIKSISHHEAKLQEYIKKVHFTTVFKVWDLNCHKLKEHVQCKVMNYMYSVRCGMPGKYETEVYKMLKTIIDSK